MIYDVRHLTSVEYEAPVQLAHFNLRLKPVVWPGQTLLDYRLTVSPTPKLIKESEGPYVVNVSRLMIAKPLSELTVESRFRIEVNAPELGANESGPSVADARRAALLSDDLGIFGPAAYLFDSRFTPRSGEIADWAAPHLSAETGVIDAARALTAAIHSEFAYDSEATEIDTWPAEAFAAKRGVCQDFAHVMIVALRAHGLSAAYVSGYLRTEPPAGEERMVGADATHAWVNVWCGPEHGWIGFDPTNDCIAGNDHIVTAMGRDYADVAPLDGVFVGSSEQKLDVAVDVIPVSDAAAEDAIAAAIQTQSPAQGQSQSQSQTQAQGAPAKAAEPAEAGSVESGAEPEALDASESAEAPEALEGAAPDTDQDGDADAPETEDDAVKSARTAGPDGPPSP